MAYLPRTLCRHEQLTAAEQEYLTGLDLQSGPSRQMMTALVESVLADRVEYFHSDPGAPHWRTAALHLYPSRNRIGQDGLGQEVYDEEMAWLRTCPHAEQALKLLIDAEQLGKEWRLKQCESKVTNLDKLRLRTSDRAAQEYHVAASLDCQQQTGFTYHDIQGIK